LEPTFTHAIAAIAADNRSGAAQIAERAADILLQRATVGQAPSPDAFRREILVTGWALIRAQAVMAPLVNLVNNVLWKIEQEEAPRSLRQAVARATDDFKRQMHQHALNIAEGALQLIEEGSTIVTLSNSSTIHHALIHAQRAGRHPTVICAESLPIREGRDAVALLASCGLTVSLMDDDAAIAAIERANLVLVGADMLTNRGLVNKVGTHRMAAAAKGAGTPFYTFCGSEKFLPPGFRPIDSAEWLLEGGRAGNPPSEITLGNIPYDFTPLELLSGIVTEQGILPVAAVEAWLAATRLHPALEHYAAEVVM
jgi:translation initiation factor 2B subunit (eIF-2B alpha/beta/delta family)